MLHEQTFLYCFLVINALSIQVFGTLRGLQDEFHDPMKLIQNPLCNSKDAAQWENWLVFLNFACASCLDGHLCVYV